MVESCLELWDWSGNCDVSNLQTMTIEIVIAFFLAVIAITADVGFYYKEKKDRVKTDSIIKDMNSVIEEQRNFILNQEKNRRNRLLKIIQINIEMFARIKEHLKNIIILTDVSKKSKEYDSHLINPIKIRTAEIEKELQQIDGILPLLMNDIKPELDKKITRIVELFLSRSNETSSNILISKSHLNLIDDILIDLENFSVEVEFGRNLVENEDNNNILSEVKKLKIKEKEELKKLYELEEWYWKECNHPHFEDVDIKYLQDKEHLKENISIIQKEIKEFKEKITSL